MCLTLSNQNASSCRSITIGVHINQDWDQDWEWNKGFKQKKILFFNKIYICLKIYASLGPSLLAIVCQGVL